MSVTGASVLDLKPEQKNLFTIKAKQIDPEICMFLAKNELLTVVPNFSHEGYKLIQGNFGPFKPNIACNVPIWLAVMLKKQNMCRMVQPEWMDVEYLKEQVKLQAATTDFIKLPYHYIEIFTIFSQNAQQDVIEFNEVSSLITDLQFQRQKNLSDMLKDADRQTVGFYISNLCQFELTMIYHHVTNVQKINFDWKKKRDKFDQIRSGESESYTGSFTGQSNSYVSQEASDNFRDFRR